MPKRNAAICSCGEKLPTPIPRFCPGCKAMITRVDQQSFGTWIPVLLIVFMIGTLIGLIAFLGYYMN